MLLHGLWTRFQSFCIDALVESCAKSIKHDASRSTFKMQLFSFRSSIILLFPGCNSCIDDNRVVIVVLMTMIGNSLLNSFCTYFWWTDFLFCVFQFLDGWVIFVEYAKPRQPPTLPSQNNTNFQYGRQWWPVRAIGLREKLVGHPLQKISFVGEPRWFYWERYAFWSPFILNCSVMSKTLCIC